MTDSYSDEQRSKHHVGSNHTRCRCTNGDDVYITAELDTEKGIGSDDQDDYGLCFVVPDWAGTLFALSFLGLVRTFAAPFLSVTSV